METSPFITVDTEFMRETVFWPKLCLIQVATPAMAVVIDPLSKTLDLTPFLNLLSNKKITKVFHAARQDIEIFSYIGNFIPSPIFDTQIAAMACGFSENAAYDSLVASLLDTKIEKGSRLTDWSKRPLSDTQLLYALNDVTHLCVIYEKLCAHLKATNRMEWIKSEMERLSDPAKYDIDPKNAWQRTKMDKVPHSALNVAKAIAAWRETEAQQRNIPRRWVLQDHVFYELAKKAPDSLEKLRETRMLPAYIKKNTKAQKSLVESINEGLKDTTTLNLPAKTPRAHPVKSTTMTLFKTLLKLCCEQHGVAEQLVATSEDLRHLIHNSKSDIRALSGWRREIFGKHALDMKQGKIALKLHKNTVKIAHQDAAE